MPSCGVWSASSCRLSSIASRSGRVAEYPALDKVAAEPAQLDELRRLERLCLMQADGNAMPKERAAAQARTSTKR
jgi:hypothetical protein